MDANPENCMVVFASKGLLKRKTSMQSVPTRSQDGIEQAWLRIEQEENLRPAKVVEIYAEWSPSPADEAFLKKQFPDVPFSFSFQRPEQESGWDEALADATLQMMQAAEQSDGDVAAATPILMPVLRNHDPSNMLTSLMVRRPLDGLGLVTVLAHVAPTPQGTVGAEWMMEAAAEGQDIDALFDDAIKNLKSAVQVQRGESKSGDKIAIVSHGSHFGASTICLPKLFTQAMDWVSSEKLFVGVPNEDLLLIAPAASQAAKEFGDEVLKSECLVGQPLSPACFEYRDGRLHRTATHPDGTFETDG